MAKKTPWGWIILGIVVFTVLVGVSLVVVAGFVVYQQFAFQATPATARSAEQKFEDIARKFEGQKPLLMLEDGDPVINRPPHDRKPARIEALHVMVWEPDNERVVSLNIPFWLIRMTNGRPIKLSTRDRGSDAMPHLKITADDLERFGPGLILLHREPGGERVIVWAQ
jgi:hypothetical protein